MKISENKKIYITNLIYYLVSKIIKGFMPQSAFIFNIIFHGMVQVEAEISHDNRIWVD